MYSVATFAGVTLLSFIVAMITKKHPFQMEELNYWSAETSISLVILLKIFFDGCSTRKQQKKEREREQNVYPNACISITLGYFDSIAVFRIKLMNLFNWQINRASKIESNTSPNSQLNTFSNQINEFITKFMRFSVSIQLIAVNFNQKVFVYVVQ